MGESFPEIDPETMKDIEQADFMKSPNNIKRRGGLPRSVDEGLDSIWDDKYINNVPGISTKNRSMIWYFLRSLKLVDFK